MNIGKERHIFLVFADFGLGGIQRKMVDIVNYLAIHPEYKNTITHLVFRFKTPITFEKYLRTQKVFIHYPHSRQHPILL